ncbi:hypothetical protein [Devosia sp. 2618]|uniref:hypothetical protein n=1 Tax=Devosia sp. 2618 TaxID=3156454 RepID=UPI00339750EC
MDDRKDGARGYAIVSDMENDLCTLRDLARLLTMSVETNTNMQEEQASALQRLGWLINDWAGSAESKRCEALEALASYRAPLPAGAAA